MAVTKRIHIDQPDEIEKVSDFIHDCLFDLEDVKFDAEQSCVRIAFRRPEPAKARTHQEFWLLKKVELPIVVCFLNINQVEHFSVKDPVQIGTYCLVDIKYNESDKTVSIISAQPIEIVASVRTLEISVEETDEIIEIKKFRSVFY